MANASPSIKGGRKLRRYSRHNTSRQHQPIRTARNKIRALKRHMALTTSEAELAKCDMLIARYLNPTK
jgi:hypothetical protein